MDILSKKINLENVSREELGEQTRDMHDAQTQNLFRTVDKAVEFKGMHIHNDKTKVLLVSDALSFVSRVHNYDSAGEWLQNVIGKIPRSVLTFISPAAQVFGPMLRQ